MLLFDVDVTIGVGERLVMKADERNREELQEALASRDFETVLSDILEPYFTNGSFRPFNAGDANPFVGLSSAPCVAEDMSHLDDGTNVIEGRFWFFPDYMLRCPIEELISHGEVCWELAGKAEESSHL
jgi:hypothetical protein